MGEHQTGEFHLYIKLHERSGWHLYVEVWNLIWRIFFIPNIVWLWLYWAHSLILLLSKCLIVTDLWVTGIIEICNVWVISSHQIISMCCWPNRTSKTQLSHLHVQSANFPRNEWASWRLRLIRQLMRAPAWADRKQQQQHLVLNVITNTTNTTIAPDIFTLRPSLQHFAKAPRHKEEIRPLRRQLSGWLTPMIVEYP